MHFAPFWFHLCPACGPLEASWIHLASILSLLGAILRPPGLISGLSSASLEPSWASLELICPHLGSPSGHLESVGVSEILIGIHVMQFWCHEDVPSSIWVSCYSILDPFRAEPDQIFPKFWLNPWHLNDFIKSTKNLLGGGVAQAFYNIYTEMPRRAYQCLSEVWSL